MSHPLPKSPISSYTNLFRGSRFEGKSPTPSPWVVIVSSFLGSFVGIGATSALFAYSTFFRDVLGAPTSLGTFGATAVLLFATIDSPLAQPRNCFFGHLIAAVVGVTVNVIFMALPDYNTIRWLACPFAVSITIFFMQLTNTLHPPAGATALIAVCNSAVFRLGYIYVAYILIAISILLLVALLLNNILRRYPLWWLRPKTRPNGDMDLELGRGEDHVVCQCQTCKEARRYSQRSRQPSIAEFAGSDARYTGEKPRTSSQFTEKYPVPPSPRVSVYSSRSFDTEYPDERMLDHALEVEEVPLDAMRHSLEQLDGEGVHVVEINRPEPSYAPESSLHR